MGIILLRFIYRRFRGGYIKHNIWTAVTDS